MVSCRKVSVLSVLQSTMLREVVQEILIVVDQSGDVA
jgi:hypothetical protein